MTKLKTMFGLCMLAALAVCAFAAQGASANTAFECVSTGGAGGVGFSDAHCKTAVGSGAAFKHVAIPVNRSKTITITNITTGSERSVAKLKTVQSGVTIEFQAKEVEGTGSIENKVSGSEMWVEGKGNITFKGVTVTAPAGKGCIAIGSAVEVIPTKPLVGTTKGLTGQLRFSPETGTTIAEFTLSGCSITALNHVYVMTGSVIGNTVGTTTNFEHTATTAQGTLFLFSQKTGLEGSLTLKAAGNGLALT
jgi:hypothetical protein